MDVVEIFKSIEGEGLRAGFPCVFVRFAGCNLHCSYCDTPYAQNFDDATMKGISPEEIVQKIEELNNECYLVTLTGGEPLLQDEEEMLQLLEILNSKGYQINIETNGSIDISPYMQSSKVMFTVDKKSMSCGEYFSMFHKNYEMLRKYDVIKFVVSNKNDLYDMWNFMTEVDTEASVFVSPVFGEIEPKEIVEFMLNYPELADVRIQLQLHKFIWNPEMRGV